MSHVRALFLEYAAATGVDLSFQNFDTEVAGLPGDYDPILLAHWNGELAGCVAMHAYGDAICEMMGKAMQLYESLGFRDIEPYRYNPIHGSRYMELTL